MTLQATEQAYFYIRVQGELDENRSRDFCGMAIWPVKDSRGLPETLLGGELHDQATLMIVLKSLYEMGLPVIFLAKVDP
jgi:hypothetical protein